MRKPATSATTIVEPTGVPARMEMMIPKNAQKTEIMHENIVTCLKLLNILIAESAGNITRAEISREPTRFMASTIMMAIMTAITVV